MSEPSTPDRENSPKIILDTLLPRAPQLDEIKHAAMETQQQLKENSISIYQLTDTSVCTLFTKSDGCTAMQPEIPNKIKGKVKAGVFIHCHPIFQDEGVKKGKSLHLLPSGYGAFHGDFAANLWSRVIGDYLNIASRYGLTINIGAEGLSRDEDVTRTLRERLKNYKSASESVWKILSGEMGGITFNQEEFPRAVSDKFSMSEDVILFSHTDSSVGTKYFLHLSWDRLKELESIYGGLASLSFGDGLQKMVEYLSLNVPHENNMATAARIVRKSPQKRT